MFKNFFKKEKAEKPKEELVIVSQFFLPGGWGEFA